MKRPSLRRALPLALLAGSLISVAPALAGSLSITSTWDLENTRRMVKELIPKEAMDVDIRCQTMERAVGNDLSRCGADWRMP
ncbi:MAG: hypothetical protein RLZZ624_1072 [Cyanobacteriota bacterium]|jgi:hypothetical protein